MNGAVLLRNGDDNSSQGLVKFEVAALPSNAGVLRLGLSPTAGQAPSRVSLYGFGSASPRLSLSESLGGSWVGDFELAALDAEQQGTLDVTRFVLAMAPTAAFIGLRIQLLSNEQIEFFGDGAGPLFSPQLLASAVPEPAALALWLVGLAAVATYRQRRPS